MIRGQDGKAIGNLILDECAERGIVVTNLSLQKLLYFTHAEFLTATERPLIRHNFEAWEYGPVLPYVYREFKSFGADPIVSRAQTLDRFSGEMVLSRHSLSADDLDVCRSAIHFYRAMSASQLVELRQMTVGPRAKA